MDLSYARAFARQTRGVMHRAPNTIDRTDMSTDTPPSQSDQPATPIPQPAQARAWTNEQPLLSIRGLCKRFGSRDVLRGVDLDVMEADVVGILGPNGCGKSTLLRCLNLLDRYHEGSVTFRGEEVSKGEPLDYRPTPADRVAARNLRQRMGMVFQKFNLFTNMSVLENVMSGPRYVKMRPTPEAREIAIRHLERVNIEPELYDRHTSTLSGGQAQRVAIARALAVDPEIMLFDEATSALDPKMTQEVLTVMRELAEGGITMLVVTHHIGFCRDVADKVVFMNEGKVDCEGTPEHVLKAQPTPAVRDFLTGAF